MEQEKISIIRAMLQAGKYSDAVYYLLENANVPEEDAFKMLTLSKQIKHYDEAFEEAFKSIRSSSSPDADMLSDINSRRHTSRTILCSIIEDIIRPLQEENLEEDNRENVQSNKIFSELQPDVQSDISPFMEGFTPEIDGLALIDRSPITRNLLKRNGDYFVMNRAEELRMKFIDEGLLSSYEIEILHNIALCVLEGRMTPNKRVIIPICHLYDLMRGGIGKKPKPSQQQKLIEDLNRMERKIEVEVEKAIPLSNQYFDNEYFTGGKFWVLTFDEIHAKKNRGQKTTYLMLPNVPILCGLICDFEMYETITGEIKAIKKLNEKTGEYEPITLTERQISIRNVLYTFAFNYRRAREKGEDFSNKLNYDDVLKACDITIKENDRNSIRRIRGFIATALDHLKRHKVITRWEEYYNKGQKKPSGVKIYIDRKELN